MTIARTAVPAEIRSSTATDLDALAGRIQGEQAEVLTAKKSAVEHATKAGNLLKEAKAQVGHGRWMSWVKANCGFSRRTANDYMRVAELAARCQFAGNHPESLRQALALLGRSDEEIEGNEDGAEDDPRPPLDEGVVDAVLAAGGPSPDRDEGNPAEDAVLAAGGPSPDRDKGGSDDDEETEAALATLPGPLGPAGNDEAEGGSRGDSEGPGLEPAPAPTTRFDDEAQWAQDEKHLRSRYQAWPEDLRDVFVSKLIAFSLDLRDANHPAIEVSVNGPTPFQEIGP